MGEPVKADDHGMTGEEKRRADAEDHKAALDAIQTHRLPPRRKPEDGQR